VGCPTPPPTTTTTTTTKPLITTIHSITPSEQIKPGIIVLIVIGIIVAIFVIITIYFLYKNSKKPNIIAYSSLDQ
jgi:multisubunit Na+/H+ antiporter MnhB subunit